VPAFAGLIAVIDVTPEGLSVIEMIPGLTLETLQALTEQKVQLARVGRPWPPVARAA
jgi:3-oxoadipate CoA-transferase, beta subunit